MPRTHHDRLWGHAAEAQEVDSGQLKPPGAPSPVAGGQPIAVQRDAQQVELGLPPLDLVETKIEVTATLLKAAQDLLRIPFPDARNEEVVGEGSSGRIRDTGIPSWTRREASPNAKVAGCDTAE